MQQPFDINNASLVIARLEENVVNVAKIMAETFGRYNIIATLSLSLSLRY